MSKNRDEYVVQYNNVPSQYGNELYWQDLAIFDDIYGATESFEERVRWTENAAGTRILHRITRISEEVVELAWRENGAE